VNSRDSRFDKLEQTRRESSISADEPSGPKHLARFEHDGGAGLHLDRDALAELPMLQCPSCKRDSSKWDAVCIYCQTSLSSPEAVVYNLQLVESRRLAIDTELELAREKREAAITAAANEQAAGIMSEARREHESVGFRRMVISIIVALPALVMVFVFAAYLLKLIFFLIFVVALACAFSPAAWAFVRQNRGG